MDNALLEPRRRFAENLIAVRNGDLLTTSLLIASKFGKRHDSVLRAVRNLECSDEFSLRNFAVGDYMDNRGKVQPIYEISRDGFSFLAMGFSGAKAAHWKEKFITAFSLMERELLSIASTRALPEWNNARQTGKIERCDLTDAVQALCARAHERLDSTTPLKHWVTAATRTVTSALFDNGHSEHIGAIRDRLTARQLNRLALAEQVFANVIVSLLDSDLHHSSVNSEAKRAVIAFASTSGGKEVPGTERSVRERLLRKAA